MGTCSSLRYCWYGVSIGSYGNSAVGRRYCYVPLYLLMDPLYSSVRGLDS